METDIAVYLEGTRLYGDDFSPEQIREWFADEEEGYAELGAGDKQSYSYVYHKLNEVHGFGHLKGRHFESVLGIGSAYGHEFQPVSEQIGSLTILDPSEAFADVSGVHGIPTRYVKPDPQGEMPFEDESFDLVASLGVLHHIPNVSRVLGECYRCLRPGGAMLLREPCFSMGDWRTPRRGLTKRERGIPPEILDGMLESAGFSVKKRAFCIFPAIPKITNKLGKAAFNSGLLTRVDALCSAVLVPNARYHRSKWLHKFAPTSLYYVLEK